MRVSNNLFTNNFLSQLSSLQWQQNQLQTQASTGLRVSLPEDDPSAMGNVLNLQADAGANSQYQNNITNIQSSAAFTSNVLNTLQSVVSKASEVAASVSGTSSKEQMSANALQVSQLLEQAVDLGNTQDSNGNYVFGGTITDQPPFVATKDASGNITGVTYQGNTSISSAEIAQNYKVSSQVIGANTTGTGPEGLFVDSRSGADLFSHLITLHNDLASGDVNTVNTVDSKALGNDEDSVINQISANGVLQSTLQATSNTAKQQSSNLNSQITDATSADMASTITKLTQAQTAYQATLQSGVLVMNLSILQYLH